MMRRVANRSSILADHTKIGRTELARSGTLADVDIFITDSGAPTATLKQFAKLGPQIVTARPHK